MQLSDTLMSPQHVDGKRVKHWLISPWMLGGGCMCQCSCADEFYMHMLWSCVRRDYNYADNDDDYGFDDDDDTSASNDDDHDDYENVDDSE